MSSINYKVILVPSSLSAFCIKMKEVANTHIGLLQSRKKFMAPV